MFYSGESIRKYKKEKQEIRIKVVETTLYYYDHFKQEKIGTVDSHSGEIM